MIYKIALGVALVLLTIVIIMLSANMKECKGIRKQVDSQVAAMLRKPTGSPRFNIGGIKEVKECRASIDIPMEMEHQLKLTDVEVKDALLRQMLPSMLESIELVVDDEYTTFTKKYIGRIRIVIPDK